MAAVAVVGPPPGLGTPATKEAAPKFYSMDVKMAAPKANRYDIRFMLALSRSPLVAPPMSMPALNQWYGDWEPYHLRGPHASQSHGLPHSPMGSIGSGARAERYARGEYGRDRNRDGPGGEDADGMNYGGVMRDGGLTNSRRDPGGRFRNNRYDERDGDAGAMRMGDAASRRFPPSGKNPFGQVSASGTFKPAGKESAEGGLDKRYNMGRIGRDRDLPPHTGGEDRRGGGRNGREREFGLARDRRRGAFEEGEEEDEWESVPKSPESERRNRAGHVADSATDWRRNSASKQGGKGALPKERESGRKTSFPAWMAEESEPSWMSEGQEESQFQLGGTGGRAAGGGGGGNSSRRPAMEEEINVDDVDVTGMDSIQAFKAQMRERERRERERSQRATSGNLAAGPPPGLERRVESEEHDVTSDGSAALQSAGLQQQAAQEKSAAALFDNFASSAKQRQQEKQQQQLQQQQQGGQHERHDQHIQSPSREEAGGDGEQATVLPGRSSRFARFFDGKPQAAALAAQQRQMEASQRALSDQSPSATVSSPSAAREGGQASANVNVADLFKGLSMDRPSAGTPSEEPKETKTSANPTAAASPPGLQRNPSEADVQSMQKIMALLAGGGGGGGGGGVAGMESHRSRDEQHSQRQEESPYGRPPPPGPAPPPPPGISFGNQGGRASPNPGARSQSPSTPYHAHPQQQQQPPPPGSWASPVASPTQAYEQRMPPPPFAGSGQGPQGGPPFRPPFPMDPRLLSRPPPQGLPPHFAAALNGMPPMGRGMPANFGLPPFPPGVRPPPPPPLPPQLQQHMMTLPPQAQHQLLMQHFQHHSAANHFGAPPQVQQQQQHSGQQHNGGNSPLPPFMSPSHASPNASQSAQLMALLGQGPGGGSGNQ